MAQSKKLSNKSIHTDKLRARRDDLANEYQKVQDALTITTNQQFQRMGAISILNELIGDEDTK